MLDLTIDRFINGLFDMQLRLRVLKYSVDPNRSLKGAYTITEVEVKQMLAERDLLRGMKASKELELWRSMRTTIDENHGNANSPSAQAILSQINLVAADEKDPLEKFRLQNLRTPSSPTIPFGQTLPPKEVYLPNVPIDHRITEIRDVQAHQHNTNAIPLAGIKSMADGVNIKAWKEDSTSKLTVDRSKAMTSSLTVASLGTPNFGNVDPNPREIARALQAFVHRGSRIIGVTLNDINLRVLRAVEHPETVTLVDLLQNGAHLFDAIIWLSAGRPANYKWAPDPQLQAEQIPSLSSIAEALFYTYFFLITQARYPAKNDGGSPPAVAKFLITIMGLTRPQHDYISMLCTFDPATFDPRWIKEIRFPGFG